MSELLLLPDELLEELELEVLDDVEELVVLELVEVLLPLDELQAGIKKHSANIKAKIAIAIFASCIVFVQHVYLPRSATTLKYKKRRNLDCPIM